MSVLEGDAQARSTADAVARRSYGKLVAFLAARTRDVAQAEDALSRRSPRRWRIGRATAVRRTRKRGCSPSPAAR
jgi:hypothetical protein